MPDEERVLPADRGGVLAWLVLALVLIAVIGASVLAWLVFVGREVKTKGPLSDGEGFYFVCADPQDAAAVMARFDKNRFRADAHATALAQSTRAAYLLEDLEVLVELKDDNLVFVECEPANYQREYFDLSRWTFVPGVFTNTPDGDIAMRAVYDTIHKLQKSFPEAQITHGSRGNVLYSKPDKPDPPQTSAAPAPAAPVVTRP